MSNLEERIAAALTARAELVRPEDLSPGHPPEIEQPSDSRWVDGLLAAACTAVLVVPFLLSGGDDGGDSPTPQPSHPTASYPASPEGAGAEWPEIDTDPRFDVDGDGVPDLARTRNQTGEKLADVPWRVEVELSSGGVPSIIIENLEWEVHLVGPVDLDGDGADEILYYNGNIEEQELGVLDLGPEGLVDLAVPDDPGITSRNTASDQLRTWWRDRRDLYSTVSEQGGQVPGADDGSNPPMPDPYPVTLYRWDLVDAELVATDLGRRCVRIQAPDRPEPC